MDFPSTLWIQLAAAAQLAVGVLNLCLVPMLGWRAELARVDLLVRQVFHVHAWFVSATLGIFAAISFRFADAIAAGDQPALVWLAAGIGGFWGLRTLLQVGYYSSSHWRGRPGRAAIHVVLLLLYSSLTAVYLAAAARGQS
jgi:hypothetical protein